MAADWASDLSARFDVCHNVWDPVQGVYRLPNGLAITREGLPGQAPIEEDTKEGWRRPAASRKLLRKPKGIRPFVGVHCLVRHSERDA